MPNVAMWGKALTAMPRIDKNEWDGLDVVSRWLIATRSAVIIMTFTSAAFAGLLAAKAGKFDALRFALVTIGLCLAHATNNLVNDLTDYWKGVDQGNYFRTQYGPQTVQDGFLSVRQLLLYTALTGGAALRGRALAARRGRVLRAVLHLAAEVHRAGRAGRARGLGAADGRRRLLRDHRRVEPQRRARERGLRARPDGGAVRQAHRQARRRPRQEDPHAAGDPGRARLPLHRSR